MSVPTSACCAVTTLSQQQENNIQHQKQCADAQPKGDRTTTKNRTVVENGRVVVKKVNS
ncbi:MAG: hypothetical protein SAK29_11270 [Scytonema sp. PMC 1069.18]|nr:hypothetical protein [Scytonema sp. PMC 1069.18]MEC4886660.1 hypothetical protein [Scytonema sp. PMC 1070.18]